MSKERLQEYTERCQALPAKQGTPNDVVLAAQKISRILPPATFCLALLSVCCLSASAFKSDEIPDRLFQGQSAPEKIAASQRHGSILVPPPMEETFFPTNFDGQAKVLNIDSTVNLTVAINQFYYNPKWRGECWTPFDQIDLIERSTRLMSTWKEYNEANQFRVLNGVNRFLERYSGFGP